MTIDEDKLATSIGRAIARKRALAGITQEQVAERLGIGPEAVSRMERGSVMPTVARIMELADIFNCAADDLLMEGSNRTIDEGRHIAQLIASLPGDDRELIVDVVRRLSKRLGQDQR